MGGRAGEGGGEIEPGHACTPAPAATPAWSEKPVICITPPSDAALQWTPAEGEGGACSLGSGVIPTVESEMFIFNMNWAQHGAPPAGEKWLICNNSNGKCVAAAGGYETGPGEIEYLGGVQREVQYFLGAKDNDTILEMRGPLVDQKIAFGPVDCKG